MIDVDIKMTEPTTVAYIEMQGPYGQIPQAMGRLYGWVAQRGLEAAGMPEAVYYTAPEEGRETEALWEVRAPVAGEPDEVLCGPDGCGIKRIEASLVASTTYRGPYEQIAPTYVELQTWLAANGYTVAGPPSESYLSDPAVTAPQDYLTEVRFPVAKA